MNYSFLKRVQRLAFWQAALVLIALASCKTDELSGLDVLPDSALDTVLGADTFTVLTSTHALAAVRSDEVQTYLGHISDGVFGSLSSSVYFNFGMPNIATGTDLSGYTVDSVRLYLRPYRIYGHYDEPISVDVIEVLDPIYPDSAYKSDRSIRIENKVLTTFEMSYWKPEFASSGDTMRIGGIRKPYMYTALVNYTLGKKLVSGLWNEYSTTADLQEFFSGFCLRAASPSNEGALHLLSLTSGESGLYVFLRDKDNNKVTLHYEITAATARFNQYTRQLDGSLLNAALADTQSIQERLFVTGLAGTKARITIPHLKLFAQQSPTAISKAELIFETHPDQPEYLNPAARLFLLATSKSGLPVLTRDYTWSPARHSGYRTGNTYKFDVTRHIQNILDSSRLGYDVNRPLELHAEVPAINGNDTAMTVLNGAGVLKLYYTNISD